MRVLVFGTYDTATHPRVGVLTEGLRASGADVFECNAPLGFGTAERVAMLNKPWRVPLLLGRLVGRWARLARQVRRLPAPDVVVVGYLGHFDVHLARWCRRGVPIALDHLIGASDTARDRRMSGGLRHGLLRWIDAAALRAADVIIVDTDEHLAALPPAHRDRGVVVPVGAPTTWLLAARPAPPHRASALAGGPAPVGRQATASERGPAAEASVRETRPGPPEQASAVPLEVVAPLAVPPPQPALDTAAARGAVDPTARAPLRVIFFGLYTPLQAAPVIGEALRRLTGAPVQVTMVGHGQDGAETRRLAADNPAVTWLDWVSPADLPALTAAHDVCLGIFGTGPKALRVVPNKVFQAAAAGCAIVTSDTAPQRRTLGDAAAFVPPGDGAALAETLLALAGDPVELSRLRAAASELARRAFAPGPVVRPLLARLREVLDRWPAGTARLTAGRVSDALAPLTPNAWLRIDAINRMLPAGITDVLEVGCGQGALGVRLAHRYRYLGLEPDPSSYAVAEQRIARAGRGTVRNASVASLADERFDLVCAFEVLEHIEHDAAALAEWASRLREGGWLVLSVPAHQRRYGPADELVGHFRRYDPAVLHALLRDAGFDDIEMRQYGMPLGYLLEAARDAIARRRLATAKDASVAERTAASGRLLQPRGGLRGAVTRWGTAPFRVAQRAFPGHGTGLIVRARLLRAPDANGQSDRPAAPANR